MSINFSFGTSSVTAAIATAQSMNQNEIKGTAKLFGTPVEETFIEKMHLQHST